MSAQSDSELSPARRKFLRLREVADLPPGGEIVHRNEVEQVAKKLGIPVEGRTKRRIIFECIKRRKDYVYPSGWDYTWEDAQAPNAARSYDYITSSEAAGLADLIEEVDRFEWQ